VDKRERHKRRKGCEERWGKEIETQMIRRGRTYQKVEGENRKRDSFQSQDCVPSGGNPARPKKGEKG